MSMAASTADALPIGRALAIFQNIRNFFLALENSYVPSAEADGLGPMSETLDEYASLPLVLRWTRVLFVSTSFIISDMLLFLALEVQLRCRSCRGGRLGSGVRDPGRLRRAAAGSPLGDALCSGPRADRPPPTQPEGEAPGVSEGFGPQQGSPGKDDCAGWAEVQCAEGRADAREPEVSRGLVEDWSRFG
jgi:hypothetical protein